ncbi:MAG: hypothetical protein PGN09_09490 [Sphingomonas fennica]
MSTILTAMALLATPPAPAGPPAAPAAPERKICRTYAEVGSLIRKQRICHTAAEWRAIDAEQQNASERMLEGRRLQTITR